MVEEEKEKKRAKLPLASSGVPLPPAPVPKNVQAISTKAMEIEKDIILAMIEAGKSNLMQGYAAVILSARYFYANGWLDDAAYAAIFELDTIMAGLAAGTSVITALFGGTSPFSPTLRTNIAIKRAESEAKIEEMQSKSELEQYKAETDRLKTLKDIEA